MIVASSPEALAAFRAFLHQLLHKYYDNDVIAFARALGIHKRSLRRSLSEDSEYTFSLENCLALAKVLRAHVSAATIFQKADKAASLKVIQLLFGRAKLSTYEETLLQASNALDPAQQEQLLHYARFLRQGTSPPPKHPR